MGSAGTKLDNTATLSDTDYNHQVTLQTSSSVVDPRSPSTLVPRTPISVVDKTEERRTLPLLQKNLNKEAINDPRSPSYLIQRTPISIVDQEGKQNTTTAQSSSKASIEFGDPRSPSNQIPRTPISSKDNDDKSSCDALDVGQISDDQQKSFPFDPRSPSTEFTRTPLNVDVNKPKSLTHQSILDPRSPSVDVTRTPLVLSTAEKEDQDEEIPDTSDAKCTPKRSSLKFRGMLLFDNSITELRYVCKTVKIGSKIHSIKVQILKTVLRLTKT